MRDALSPQHYEMRTGGSATTLEPAVADESDTTAAPPETPPAPPLLGAVNGTRVNSFVTATEKDPPSDASTVVPFYATLTSEEQGWYGATKMFSGQNIVLFGGRMVFGPNLMQLAFTMAAITGPCVAFWAAVAPVLYGAWTAALSACYIVTMLSLLQTATTNPGIVARRLDGACNPPVEEDAILPCGTAVKLRFCYTCRIYRGPRSHHCSFCDNCVDIFDHHCPWTGTCVGAYNYHTFLHFLHGLNLLAALMVICSAVATWQISKCQHVSVMAAMGQLSYVPIALIVVVLTVCFPVTGLMLFHHHLIANNKTTLEHLRRIHDGKVNPYDLGICVNYYQKFFGKFDTSLLSSHFRYVLIKYLKPTPSTMGKMESIGSKT